MATQLIGRLCGAIFVSENLQPNRSSFTQWTLSLTDYYRRKCCNSRRCSLRLAASVQYSLYASYAMVSSSSASQPFMQSASNSRAITSETARLLHQFGNRDRHSYLIDSRLYVLRGYTIVQFTNQAADYIVQDSRYIILEDSGCQTATSSTNLGIVFDSGLPLYVSAVTSVYSGTACAVFFLRWHLTRDSSRAHHP